MGHELKMLVNRQALVVCFLAWLYLTVEASSKKRKYHNNKKPVMQQIACTESTILNSSRSLPENLICYARREESPPALELSIAEALNYTKDPGILIDAYSRYFSKKLVELSSPIGIMFILEMVYPSTPEELLGRPCPTSFRTRMLTFAVCGMICVFRRLWKAIGDYRRYGWEEWPDCIDLLFKLVYYLDIGPFFLLIVMFPVILDWPGFFLLLSGAFMFYTIWLEVTFSKS